MITETVPQRVAKLAILLGLIMLLTSHPRANQHHASEMEVNVYSARQESLIKPLLQKFTKISGIRVNLVTGKADVLLARLQAEGENSPVDVLITTDAGRLYRAHSSGLLHCIGTQGFEHIPKSYRDPEGCWFGLSLRARVIMTVRGSIAENALTSYTDLAAPRWKNNICVRSSSNIYNQSLVAAILAATGETATKEWLRGVVANFARQPGGGDRDQILAAANGLCDIVVANTYYLAMMLKSHKDEHRKAAEKMRVVFPDQNSRGTHVNVSGAGISRWAPHFDHGLALLKYLSSTAAQSWYAETNYEYPVSADVPIPTILQLWGDFRKDILHLRRLGELNATALKLMNAAGWR